MTSDAEDTARRPCRECQALALPSTLEATGGLCRPCFKRPQQARQQEQVRADRKDEDLIDVGRRSASRHFLHGHKRDAIERFRVKYSALLTFLSDNGLTREPFVAESVSDWADFEVRYSMLTAEGVELVGRCYQQWIGGLDRGTKPTYVGLWKKELAALRAGAGGGSNKPSVRSNAAKGDVEPATATRKADPPRARNPFEYLYRKTRKRPLDVDVEDILAVGVSGTREDAAALRKLAEELQWSRGPGGAGQPVPLGKWSDVTCAFLEGGYPGLDAYARDADSFRFATGLLAKLKTPDSVDVINRLAARFADLESLTHLAHTLNPICSLKEPPALSEQAQADARRWLHSLLGGPAGSRAWAAYALRGVGDAESVALLSALPPLPSPHVGAGQQAIRGIRKRLRAV